MNELPKSSSPTENIIHTQPTTPTEDASPSADKKSQKITKKHLESLDFSQNFTINNKPLARRVTASFQENIKAMTRIFREKPKVYCEAFVEQASNKPKDLPLCFQEPTRKDNLQNSDLEAKCHDLRNVIIQNKEPSISLKEGETLSNAIHGVMNEIKANSSPETPELSQKLSALKNLESSQRKILSYDKDLFKESFSFESDYQHLQQELLVADQLLQELSSSANSPLDEIEHSIANFKKYDLLQAKQSLLEGCKNIKAKTLDEIPYLEKKIKAMKREPLSAFQSVYLNFLDLQIKLLNQKQKKLESLIETLSQDVKFRELTPRQLEVELDHLLDHLSQALYKLPNKQKKALIDQIELSSYSPDTKKNFISLLKTGFLEKNIDYNHAIFLLHSARKFSI